MRETDGMGNLKGGTQKGREILSEGDRRDGIFEVRETDGMRDVMKGRARNGMERVGEGKSEIREDLEKDGSDGKGRV